MDRFILMVNEIMDIAENQEYTQFDNEDFVEGTLLRGYNITHSSDQVYKR